MMAREADYCLGGKKKTLVLHNNPNCHCVPRSYIQSSNMPLDFLCRHLWESFLFSLPGHPQLQDGLPHEGVCQVRRPVPLLRLLRPARLPRGRRGGGRRGGGRGGPLVVRPQRGHGEGLQEGQEGQGTGVIFRLDFIAFTLVKHVLPFRPPGVRRRPAAAAGSPGLPWPSAAGLNRGGGGGRR